MDKFELIGAEISKLGVRVESEKLEAQDVTKQYVDLSARLHNFHAQEAQYLGILKQAKTVKDTVEVSDKLNEVRAQIEQQQAEFDALSKQVETVALTINLGQPGEDYEVIKAKAMQLGALDCHVVDAREEFAREYLVPAIKANALYGGGYPLFTALGRPLIAKIAVEKARESGCDTVAHGCTGKGNDQVRFDVAFDSRLNNPREPPGNLFLVVHRGRAAIHGREPRRVLRKRALARSV